MVAGDDSGVVNVKELLGHGKQWDSKGIAEHARNRQSQSELALHHDSNRNSNPIKMQRKAHKLHDQVVRQQRRYDTV